MRKHNIGSHTFGNCGNGFERCDCKYGNCGNPNALKLELELEEFCELETLFCEKNCNGAGIGARCGACGRCTGNVCIVGSSKDGCECESLFAIVTICLIIAGSVIDCRSAANLIFVPLFLTLNNVFVFLI